MLSQAVQNSYWVVFRRKSHVLIGIGYQTSLDQIRKQEWEEDEITEFITEQIEKYLDEQRFTSQFPGFFVQEQRPVNRPGRHGKKRQKIDIVIRCPQQRHSVAVFAFEAKRLRTGGFPIGKYTGEEGMYCFLNDEYAEKMPEAAMVAYFQNKSASYWERQLRRSITS